MSLSEVFIRRPVATGLLAAGLFMAGMVAFVLLPVAPLPRVDFPTINVSAKLPGADPETMAATVAAPLERRLGQIAGVSELTSSSAQGATTITAQFDLDRNIDGAARDVEAAINAAGTDMPVDLPNPPTYRKANPADSPIMILAATSSTLSQSTLYDASDTILSQRISQIEGVAQVTISGADKPAIRIGYLPPALAATGLSAEDVRTMVANANVNAPKGYLNSDKQSMAISVNDQLSTAEKYGSILLRSGKDTTLRLSDVANVTNSVENDRQAGWFNMQKAVLIIIQKQADANIIETVDRIKTIMPKLESWMPAGTTITVLSDRTQTIRSSVEDVEITLLISVLLVVLVVWFALGRVTPTFAACITVPLSLAGTFIVMWLLNYSIDNISLLALTISVGFVVDDAIVMIENIARHVEDGDSPFTAAIKGAKEITFTIISISISLVAVFIPLLFMGGVIGRLFREFAVTLSVAVAVSVVIAITVTPTLYAWLMHYRNRDGNHAPHDDHMGERFFAKIEGVYQRGLKWAVVHEGFMLLVTLATVIITVYLYIVIPKGFFPQQDTGMIMGSIEARTDISFAAMQERHLQVLKILTQDPSIEGIGSFLGTGGGGGGGNQGRLFITLKPLSERSERADEIISRLRPKLAHIEGVSVFLQAAQDIRVGGRSSKAQFQFALSSESLAELREWTPKLIDKLKQEKDITDVSSDQDKAIPEMELTVDRDRAAQLGVDVEAVDQVLQDAFAQRQISTMYASRNQYHVVYEAADGYKEDVGALDHVYVKDQAGALVKLSSLVTMSMSTAPVSVMHQGQFPASTLTFNLPPGAALGDAAKRIEAATQEIGMPDSIHSGFAGNAKAFADSLRDEPILICAALITIYIVLGILYENLLHPLTILSTLPSAGIGALLALLLSGNELSLISIIGVILLMGIVKKNGIILVDFAIIAERNGMSPSEAIIEACSKRFRPILMTTMAAVLGAVPLIVAYGNGSELRRPLGIAIVGGLIVSQCLTLFTTPIVYLALARRFKKHHQFQAAEGQEA